MSQILGEAYTEEYIDLPEPVEEEEETVEAEGSAAEDGGDE